MTREEAIEVLGGNAMKISYQFVHIRTCVYAEMWQELYHQMNCAPRTRPPAQKARPTMPNDFISREVFAEYLRYKIATSMADVANEAAIALIETLVKLMAIPPADVVPVVRCGECIHRVNMEHSMDNKEICCGRMAMRVMALDDYCSHGVCMERRQPEGG